MRVIVMDHNKTTKDNLSGYLTWIGHSCHSCSCEGKEFSGCQEAKRLIEKYRPDVIVTDLEMPLDGIVLLKSIKKRYPEIKVLIWTARTNMKDALDAVNFHADGFFRKTLDNIKLANEIRRENQIEYH